jgi:hypothetical protein
MSLVTVRERVGCGKEYIVLKVGLGITNSELVLSYSKNYRKKRELKTS